MNKLKLLPVMAYRGVKQNKLVYRPYLMACFFSVFSYYLFSSLLHNDLMERLPKAAYAWLMLTLGKGLLSIILLLFLLYAGSFLQKRRRRELGLYSLLGLERKHIGIMLFWENTGLYLVSVSAGIVLGFVLNKLMFLLLLRMSRLDVEAAFYFSADAVMETLRYFAIVFLCVYIKSIWSFYRMKPTELLAESRKGEKELKRIWLWTGACFFWGAVIIFPSPAGWTA
jgi:putative ABC transport system permease protein